MRARSGPAEGAEESCSGRAGRGRVWGTERQAGGRAAVKARRWKWLEGNENPRRGGQAAGRCPTRAGLCRPWAEPGFCFKANERPPRVAEQKYII